MNIEKGNKLNQLLQHWQSGGLFFSSWLMLCINPTIQLWRWQKDFRCKPS